MNGARQYAELFKTGQYKRLYIVSGSHARGRTFHIFVLPKDEKAISSGPNNPPLNKNAIEVYGVIGGHPGWTEGYGWLHDGKWQGDFIQMVKQRKNEIEAETKARDARRAEKVVEEEAKAADLLATY